MSKFPYPRHSFDNPIRFADHSGLTAVDFGNAGSTIAFAPSNPAPCDINCGLSATGLIIEISGVVLDSKTLKALGDVLVLPSMAVQLTTDVSNGVDLGHALGRLGVNAALQAGILAVGGPAGLVIDVAYDAAYLLFPNQINGAIDVTFTSIGNQVRATFGINTAY